MESTNDWKEKWVNEQLQNSEHPFDFWMNVADNIILGRRHNDANPFSPMGKDLNNKKTFAYLVDLYYKTMKFENEHEKKTEAALAFYEILIAERFNDKRLYDHLREYYNRRQWFKDALRIAKAALDAGWPAGVEKPKVTIDGFKFKIKPIRKK